jgi:acyl dehydratase
MGQVRENWGGGHMTKARHKEDAAAEAQLFLDDFAPGQSFAGSTRLLDEASFVKFAELTGDAHPIHYDEDYARNSKFGARVAHGLLVSSVSALGATPLSARLEQSMVAFLGQCFTFLKPVLIGDSVRSVFTVQSIEAAPGRSSGTLKFAVAMINQRDELVAEGTHFYMLRRRSPLASKAH